MSEKSKLHDEYLKLQATLKSLEKSGTRDQTYWNAKQALLDLEDRLGIFTGGIPITESIEPELPEFPLAETTPVYSSLPIKELARLYQEQDSSFLEYLDATPEFSEPELQRVKEVREHALELEAVKKEQAQLEEEQKKISERQLYLEARRKKLSPEQHRPKHHTMKESMGNKIISIFYSAYASESEFQKDLQDSLEFLTDLAMKCPLSIHFVHKKRMYK